MRIKLYPISLPSARFITIIKNICEGKLHIFLKMNDCKRILF